MGYKSKVYGTEKHTYLDGVNGWSRWPMA